MTARTAARPGVGESKIASRGVVGWSSVGTHARNYPCLLFDWRIEPLPRALLDVPSSPQRSLTLSITSLETFSAVFGLSGTLLLWSSLRARALERKHPLNREAHYSIDFLRLNVIPPLRWESCGTCHVMKIELTPACTALRLPARSALRRP